MTLADVAERMVIDVPGALAIEDGKDAEPALTSLHKCAAALGMKLDVGLVPG